MNPDFSSRKPFPEPRTRLLLGAGLAAALCWSAADMLLVGFAVDPERYPLFSQTLAPLLGDDVDIAVLMLAGSEQRLFWGVLPATFSMVLYLAAAVGAYRLIAAGRAAKACLALLLAGYALSPLGHAGFYYVGMAAKTLAAVPPDAHAPLVALFAAFHKMLAVHWFASVGISAAAWLLVLGLTLGGRTRLPRRAAWCNPIPVGLAVGFACSLFPQSPLAAAIGSATFNLAQAAFYGSALCYAFKRQKAAAT
ncbi:Uncharacterised protein [Kingella potus]|uniref:Uncharacterized protein n=1 Tax=Kingella potus TaxID=265175 RepID=A0A377R1K5_9NEIS|nr:DUF6796 family protein [Kingella potus]STR00870.1 Uncharacterised protein [Kingella potus]